MKNKVQVALLIMLIVGCQIKTETGNSEIDKKGQKELDVTKTEPRVTGIGGIFFKTENPQKMKEWYG
ncbi:MAG: VOC family protein, partial [Bacteroidota bacterium]